MPQAARRYCTTGGCPRLLALGERCPEHDWGRLADQRRPSAQARGYGARWAAIRRRFIAAHPTCQSCGAASVVPDHWPLTRRQLVAMGVSNPDADEFLRPLCVTCHNRATSQASGWSNRKAAR